MRGPGSRGGGGQREGAVPPLGRYGLEGFAFVQERGEEVAINFLPQEPCGQLGQQKCPWAAGIRLLHGPGSAGSCWGVGAVHDAPEEGQQGGVGEAPGGAYLCGGGALRARGPAGARRCSGAARGWPGRAGRPSCLRAVRLQPQRVRRGPSAQLPPLPHPAEKRRVLQRRRQQQAPWRRRRRRRRRRRCLRSARVSSSWAGRARGRRGEGGRGDVPTWSSGTCEGDAVPSPSPLRLVTAREALPGRTSHTRATAAAVRVRRGLPPLFASPPFPEVHPPPARWLQPRNGGGSAEGIPGAIPAQGPGPPYAWDAGTRGPARD